GPHELEFKLKETVVVYVWVLFTVICNYIS
ncbi:MAG: hypothetical protein K0R50_2599, partial [Eubacterium sp.]|nr:hypothetical protein [Eubacterium sp.]